MPPNDCILRALIRNIQGALECTRDKVATPNDILRDTLPSTVPGLTNDGMAFILVLNQLPLTLL